VLSQGHAGADQDRPGFRRAAAHRRDGRGRERPAQARDGAQVAGALGGNLRGKTIAVLGLTFKPNTDDLREAPSIPLITALKDMGATVRAYDPVGMTHAGGEFPDVAFADGPYACAEGADALVIVTEWEQFRALDLERIKQAMKQPVLIDLRNVYRPDEMAEMGFVYDSVGRARAGE
jgi:UDPglucose 6-dehydrogenase